MNNLSTIKSELEICKESFLQTQIVIGKKNELDKALDRVKESYNEIQLIVDSTDPTKGIPLIITKKFLGAAESVKNDILNNVYNGQFNIQFRLNEKDFFIHVVKSNGSELDDVLDLSSGQCAIIKTALSFAMIQNFIGDYNIPILDELDSTLDENNRRSFLDILKRQIENTNIEQAFIISHNNEFFAEKDLTLLLFNGHSAPTSDASFVARNTIVNI
jgi:DNA repair exonuclease SbcCD ATPase subunit